MTEKPKNRKCLHCGAPLDLARTRRAAYCNKKCVSAAFFARRPDKMAEYSHRAYQKRVGPKLVDRKCMRCGGLLPEQLQRKAKYCGKQCGVAACGAKWYRENKEKKEITRNRWKKRNPDKVRLFAREWAQRNKAKMVAKTQKRNALKLQAIPKWLTSRDFEAMEQIYQAAREATELTGVRHEVDHFYPLRGKDVCGLHCPKNLRVIPHRINRRKRNHLYHEPYQLGLSI